MRRERVKHLERGSLGRVLRSFCITIMPHDLRGYYVRTYTYTALASARRGDVRAQYASKRHQELRDVISRACTSDACVDCQRLGQGNENIPLFLHHFSYFAIPDFSTCSIHKSLSKHDV